jgi:hypothetical protein
MSLINRENHKGDSNGEKIYPFAKWMSWLFLVASTVLLIYTYYRAEITFQGARGVVYFKYYLISLVGILFWGVVLRLREGVRANIVTIVISLVVSLYLIEGGLRLFKLPADISSHMFVAKKYGVEFDTRTQLEVITDLIASGEDAIPAIRPYNIVKIIDEMLPLGGISRATTVSSNETGRFMVYPSDRYGFNNPDSEWDSSKVDYLLTGDSFAEGLSVQPGEDIAGQIRLMTKKSVISLGRSGNGPLMELAAISEYAPKLHPKRVLWVYYESNDLTANLPAEKMFLMLMNYLDDNFSQNLINHQPEIDQFLREYAQDAQDAQEKTEWIKLLAVRQLLNLDTRDIVDPLFSIILNKAKSRTEAWGGELYFVYLPGQDRYKNTVISHDQYRQKAEILNLVESLNIPIIDIHQQVFAKHFDPLSLFPFRVYGHYNAVGYSKVAKAIIKKINHQELK